ncbi:MAG: hypothetical protein Q9213_001966 [Squamulea squamosa]
MDQDKTHAVKAAADEWDKDYEYQKSFLVPKGSEVNRAYQVYVEETKTAPLFSVDVAKRVCASSSGNIYHQYGLLAGIEATYDPAAENDSLDDDDSGHSAAATHDNRIYLNVNAPFSAFVCGSQGSGKSHTLSCMLEASLKASQLGKLPHPLTGLLFHWDRHTTPCEAAYLCSSIQVNVLVSPFYFEEMKEKYKTLPLLGPDSPKPVVRPLLLRQRHLNVERMMKLMAVDTKSERPPLYIELVRKILQEVGRHRKSNPDRFYTNFREKLPKFSSDQISGLKQRLSLLERFLDGVLCPDGIGYFHGVDPMPDFKDTNAGIKARQRWKDE